MLQFTGFHLHALQMISYVMMMNKKLKYRSLRDSDKKGITVTQKTFGISNITDNNVSAFSPLFIYYAGQLVRPSSPFSPPILQRTKR